MKTLRPIRSIEALSLQTRLVLLLITFTLIPVVLFGGVIYWKTRDILLSVRIDQLNALADLKKDKIETFFLERRLDLQAVQQIRSIRTGLAEIPGPGPGVHAIRVIAKADLDSRLVHFTKAHRYLDIMLLTPRGSIIYVSNPAHADELGKKLQDQDSLVEQARRGIVFSGILTQHGHRGEYEIIGLAPITDERGTLLYLVAIEIDMSPVYDSVLESRGLGKSGEALVVTRQGNDVLFLSPLRGIPDAALKKTTPLSAGTSYPAQRAALGETGSGIARDYSGKEVLAAWRFIPELRWGIVLKMDTHEAFAPMRLQRGVILLVSFLMVVLSVIAAALLADSIIRPLRTLRQGTAAIAEGDLGHRVGMELRNEIGALSRDFDAMAEALERDRAARTRSEREVRTLNAELEHNIRRITEANRELDAFSYSVSHDLRSPLRGIDGFSRALLEDYQDKLDAQGRDYLYRIRNATTRMERLIDDLLNLSRLARFEMKRERVDLSALAHTLADRLRGDHPGRAAAFVIADGLVAEGDAHLLSIALENLLGNAWKFSEKTPRTVIEFGAIRRDGKTTFFVKDNGAGLDMTFADKLFQPFQRLHSEAEFAGTGIGLATVRRIISRHGGEVRIEGEPGKGATVFFTLG
jgi:signal transduction histidine kinase